MTNDALATPDLFKSTLWLDTLVERSDLLTRGKFARGRADDLDCLYGTTTMTGREPVQGSDLGDLCYYLL